MDLRTAILRASRFAAKPSDPNDSLKYIRFLPGNGSGDKPKLFATNGLLGVVITLDDDVEIQNASVPADLCTQMAKESGYIARMDWLGNGLEFTARRAKGIETYRYKMPVGNISLFPSFQTPPEPLEYFADWKYVMAVVHAASSPKTDNQVFRCVRFSSDVVEATDRYRVARADIVGGCCGLVPKELFAHWPKGDVFAGFTAIYAFFRIGDEIRYSPLVHGKYPDVRAVLPDEHRGSSAICPVAPLLAAVKQASKMTKVRSVSLDFKDDTVKVSSWTHRPDQQFTTVVRADGAISGSVLVNGANFLEALKSFSTPRVLLGYGPDPTSLLRLESGRLTVCLWPMTEPNVEGTNAEGKG